MCERLILEGQAYICPPCWEELLTYKATWPETMSAAEVRERIEDFMHKSPPGTFLLVEKADIDAEFERLTG
jgi:hypothetical protein